MPRIAVHIVTFNSQHTIGACLQSLKTQDIEYELCIVDNASTDGTAQYVRELGLPVHVSGENSGYSAAHNRALAMTHSDFVLTLNPDVVLQPGFLNAMLAAIETDSSLGSASGCLLRVDRLAEPPYAIDSTGLFMRRSRRQGLRLENEPVANAPQMIQQIFGPDGAAALYRRAMLDDIAINGEIFDEDFFMHKEDIDICWRAQLAGWRSVYVPDAKAHHIRQFRPNQRQRVDSRLRMLAVRNRYLLMLKNEVPRLFIRDLLRILVYEFAIFGYILLREPASLRAYISAWGLRRQMIRKRRSIQSHRRAETAGLASLFE